MSHSMKIWKRVEEARLRQEEEICEEQIVLNEKYDQISLQEVQIKKVEEFVY